MNSRAQIVATIGPASAGPDMLCTLINNGMDVARLNFAWIDCPKGEEWIDLVREGAASCNRTTKIIADLPGPRVQHEGGHGYDASLASVITPRDEETLLLCAQKNVEYVALSFVGSAADIEQCRALIAYNGGSQKIIAKIERTAALEHLDEIIAAADGVMVARGDLGSEVPLEEIPFIQKRIVERAKAAGKPVIVATQMMLSMTEHSEPTRAEVTDVEEAIMQGADAVMLSEETASGKFPAEATAMMERAVAEAEKHRPEGELGALHTL